MKNKQKLKEFYIPEHLLESFDDFITIALTNLYDTAGDKSSWTDEEIEIYDWMNEGKYKNT